MNRGKIYCESIYLSNHIYTYHLKGQFTTNYFYYWLLR